MQLQIKYRLNQTNYIFLQDGDGYSWLAVFSLYYFITIMITIIKRWFFTVIASLLALVNGLLI